MNFEEKLEQLLRKKKYSELTEGEQNYVNDFVTREEYVHFRLIICAGKNSHSNPVVFPSKKIKQNLLATMREKRKKERPVTTFLSKVADYQLPMWQAAAMIAGLLFIVSFGKNQFLEINPEAAGENFVVLVDTVYETKYDTVYSDLPADVIGKNVNVSPKEIYKSKQKIAPSRKTLTKNRPNENDHKPFEMPTLPEAAPLLADTLYPNNLRELLPPEKYMWNEKSVGRSLRDEMDLIQFSSELN